MDVLRFALTHTSARRLGKSPFFFSHFYFDKMKEKKNTHFCFACGGDVGFKLGKEGKPVDQGVSKDYDPMRGHDSSHSIHVIGNVHKYSDVDAWLEKEIPANFPYVVSVT